MKLRVKWHVPVLLPIAIGIVGFIGQLLAARVVAESRRQVVQEIEALRKSWVQLATSDPRPERENLRRLREEIHQLEGMESGLTERLFPSHPVETPEAFATQTDLFFGIASFIERLKQECAGANIRLESGLDFGFRAFTEARKVVLAVEPDSADGKRELLIVRSQLAELDFLCSTLCELRPSAILEVNREPVSDREEYRGAETFRINPRLSASVPGLVETRAYRIRFRGRTDTLRRFLNAVGNSRIPLVIRYVEVIADTEESSTIPGDWEDSSSTGSMMGGTSPWRRRKGADEALDTVDAVPVVEDNLSTFEVVLEACSPLQGSIGGGEL